MYFEKEGIYPLYNQGNNRRKIFYSEQNFKYFIEKIRKYIIPYADILSWCLMPNHFHLMVYIHRVTLSHPVNNNNTRTLNDSIAIMLRSYTRAVNKEQNRTGSLFREETKAKPLNGIEGISPSWFTVNGITQINIQDPELQHPQVCFNYIHLNPVKHNLVKNTAAWKYSSFHEYCGNEEFGIVNKNKAKELELLTHRVTWSHPVSNTHYLTNHSMYKFTFIPLLFFFFCFSSVSY